MTLPFFRSIAGPLSSIPNSLVLDGLPQSQIGVGAGSWLWRMEQRMLILWHLEANVNGVPERIESADVIVWSDGSGFAQQIAAGPHRLRGDEPESVGGTGTGPSPYDFLLAALGSCTSMTVGMYARQKKWPLERVTVWLRHSKIYAADCAECESKEGMLDRIEREVRFEGPLTAEQRSRLLEIANKCPVHRTLTSEISIRTQIV